MEMAEIPGKLITEQSYQHLSFSIDFYISLGFASECWIFTLAVHLSYGWLSYFCHFWTVKLHFSSWMVKLLFALTNETDVIPYLEGKMTENIYLKNVTSGILHRSSLVFHFECDGRDHEFAIKRIHSKSLNLRLVG